MSPRNARSTITVSSLVVVVVSVTLLLHPAQLDAKPFTITRADFPRSQASKAGHSVKLVEEDHGELASSTPPWCGKNCSGNHKVLATCCGATVAHSQLGVGAQSPFLFKFFSSPAQANGNAAVESMSALGTVATANMAALNTRPILNVYKQENEYHGPVTYASRIKNHNAAVESTSTLSPPPAGFVWAPTAYHLVPLPNPAGAH
ncbi:hypothetical protein BV898_02698 [Hypsibius exemplaris]|uniref:Uncharacterized protein n=1 Tax=Hypsibius exemplaris TaxID=2072580 RepID=A0A1W0X876_HYPEX|nr:hypothetical protein BV898_02698 [Hypsibius exemplaris]